MTQSLPHDTFTRALLVLNPALPHGILPWTGFPTADPPETVTREMWLNYTWNPPQFAAAEQPETYATADPDATPKPEWSAIVTAAGPLVADLRRQERSAAFASTLSRMNPVWFATLTSDQTSRITAWRQEWLDAPETGQTPVTDVSDIFLET